jgi:hypothetical protein
MGLGPSEPKGRAPWPYIRQVGGTAAAALSGLKKANQIDFCLERAIP